MITLEMIHETINALRDRAKRAHFGFEYWRDTCPTKYGDIYAIHASDAQVASKLAMAWHDVVRGCRTDEDLHMRLAEFSWPGEFSYLGCDEELSLVVTMLRADSCDALRRGDTSTMNALDDLVRRLEARDHRR